LIAATESEVTVSINKHYEYSRLIEDIVEAQALNSMRQFYTSDAGYALSRQVDTDLIQLGRLANGGSTGAQYTLPSLVVMVQLLLTTQLTPTLVTLLL
jgi:hypothetical protein